MTPQPIGTREFLDGSTRLVYVEADGRQFVIDDDGQRLYGVWLYREADEPTVETTHLPISPVIGYNNTTHQSAIPREV